MSEAVRVYIERVKAALRVTTDEELAARIGYSKQAVANWRRRNDVPRRAELCIISILGDEFIVKRGSDSAGQGNWNDLARGLAVFAIDQYISHWSRPLSYPHIRAVGRCFDELVRQIRKLLIAYTAATYPQDQVFDAVIRIIEKREDRQIHEILSALENEYLAESETN